MKVFLTGGSGMVGRNILEHPSASRHHLVAPTRQELDLCDFTAVCRALDAHRPDAVIHAAGMVGGIHANIARPVDFLVHNWDMGRNVVLGAAQVGVPCLINLGSSCMYPRGHDRPLREEQLLSGELEPTNEGYALAKCAVARLSAYVGRQYPGLSYKTLIPCNLFGRYDKYDPAASHLLAAVIEKMHSAKIAGTNSVEIWGDGTVRREFMLASDLAAIVWTALENYAVAPPLLNVGPGEDCTVNEVYRLVAEVVGFKGSFNHDLERPVGMARKVLDVSRLKALGWSRLTPLTEGIATAYRSYVADVATLNVRLSLAP